MPANLPLRVVNSAVRQANPAEELHVIRDTLPAAAAQAVAPLPADEREAARILGVSPRTVWGLNAAGKLPCVWLAKRVKRYRLSDLQRYVDSLQSK
jgi:hypothetical protein